MIAPSDLTPNQKGNMEQRIEDLIERLQSFDGATRIEGYVNLSWNRKRTALVATEDNLLDKIAELENVIRETDKTVDKLRERRDELLDEVQSLKERISELEKEIENQ